jgi:hypothetical protein
MLMAARGDARVFVFELSVSYLPAVLELPVKYPSLDRPQSIKIYGKLVAPVLC